MDHNEPSPYRTLTNVPETPVTPTKRLESTPKDPKKKPSPIKFPEATPKKNVKERLTLGENTTPRSSTSSGPRRNKLYMEPEPWLRGFAPKCNNEHAPIVNGQATNWPEIPRSQLIHPSGWYQDKNGKWFNDSICTKGEDEVGSVEPSEEEENRKKH